MVKPFKIYAKTRQGSAPGLPEPDIGNARLIHPDGPSNNKSHRYYNNRCWTHMAETPLTLLNSEARSEWVRLRTLINLRWLAVIGQSGAVLFAVFELGLILDVGLSMAAIGASVAFNIASAIIYPENKRLSEREAMLTLLFDLSQLMFLLFLTGGLNNPFALLILAPVTISATALRLQSTIFLGMMAILMITIVVRFHIPLRTRDGFILRMPNMFLYGFWISLVIGVVFLAGYARRVSIETHSMSQALLATQMALGREQKLTDLGGVVAAAAHELGTPLATIKLVSSELLEDIGDQPGLRDDIILIRDQANRCRDILRDMGRTGKDDMLLHHAPVSAVVREAAEPHEDRGKDIHFTFAPKKASDASQPQIRRQPEIIHGLRNLIQNAVDFSTANVWVDVLWSDKAVRVVVADDGQGYPPELIGRIGDPFVRKRQAPADNARRPQYEGMGLGLFIAKTLLERSGAEITFANGTDPFPTLDHFQDRWSWLFATRRRRNKSLKSAFDPSGSDPALRALSQRRGAIVEVLWPREKIERDLSQVHAPLGQNAPLEI